MTWDRFIFISLFLVVFSMTTGCNQTAPAPNLPPVSTPPPAGKAETFSHAEFDTLLKKYVVGGRVKYSEWVANAADKAALAEYVKRLATAHPEYLPENDQKAFWINAYNAITLNSVLEKYPLKSVNFDALKDPKAKNFWQTPYPVANTELSLDQIENKVLRPRYKDPRIHFAINCASVGCPNLQPRAFEGKDLNEFLDTVTREFLADATKGANWDAASGRLSVSSIFDWYQDDFGNVPSFVAKYRSDITAANAKVVFLTYDWNLNQSN